MRSLRTSVILVPTIFVAACGGKGADTAATDKPTGPVAAVDAAKPTGKIITVEMIADEKGSRYVPSEIEAHRGDVIRYSLTVGVHNVNFLADSNPGVPNLPAASEMLQLPGQTFDLPVNLREGKYYFQCDPHVLLGMKGHLKVEE
jgi:plastocyanin